MRVVAITVPFPKATCKTYEENKPLDPQNLLVHLELSLAEQIAGVINTFGRFAGNQ